MSSVSPILRTIERIVWLVIDRVLRSHLENISIFVFFFPFALLLIKVWENVQYGALGLPGEEILNGVLRMRNKKKNSISENIAPRLVWLLHVDLSRHWELPIPHPACAFWPAAALNSSDGVLRVLNKLKKWKAICQDCCSDEREEWAAIWPLALSPTLVSAWWKCAEKYKRRVNKHRQGREITRYVVDGMVISLGNNSKLLAKTSCRCYHYQRRRKTIYPISYWTWSRNESPASFLFTDRARFWIIGIRWSFSVEWRRRRI